MKEKSYRIYPLGRIHCRNDRAWIEIDAPYRGAMLGLEQFSHINVLYWFDQNDTPPRRAVLQVHPCKNTENPLTGVFATHSPQRPNLIALTRCRIEAIEGNRIYIDKIDARDNSPLIDIKCFIPEEEDTGPFRIAGWVPRKGDRSV